MRYEGNLKSLNARPLPQWYDDAKLGIFIHWGIWAIPAFAPHLGSISDAFKKDYDRAVAMTPYTEWYWNAIKVPGTPSAEFHASEYGNRPYQAFREPFEEGLKHWDPDAWAEAFRNSGAKYVVLVTKHHDGFCLWPSAVDNPHERNWTTKRDIVGELARAVRAQGLRFGVYYSGGIDWTFNREPLRTFADFVGSMPGGDYPAYAMAQTRELIERYEPSILWNDISWPTGLDGLLQLFADYYNAVPEGVVNDRWVHARLASKLLRYRLPRRLLDFAAKRYIRKHPHVVEGVIPQPIPHSDFRTPEYTRFPTIQSKKWESTRGMSHSFGFNRNDSEADYATPEQLLSDFIDGASKGGNLLLNVGPRGTDGGIPDEQLARLKFFGDWLAVNGAAVYGTTPWKRDGTDCSDTRTDTGMPVRFTRSGNDIHIIPLGAPAGGSLRLRNVRLSGQARLVADGSPVALRQEANDLVVDFAKPLVGNFAPAVTVSTLE
ncbi:alpha-L-fucosidase [Parvibaculum sp.]|uniref:alpha-L-fucosidase n=3 Tax=Parvibaculum sp. TaxID=2024848 RepID=UPI001B23BBE1|nr:alpha-L-fucosidase [Parvibaculum sp.]MBO6667251.1 alpha-L-fucosidase [Parvibaculum sp.]MBO6713804.1 alpha-L-fucosidase [Parvibaculum sp.]